jgi:putative membrane protein
VRLSASALVGLFLCAKQARAHELGQRLVPAELAVTFTLEPWVVLPLVGVGLAYGRGRWRGAGRGAGARRREDACFAAGWLVLVLALVSPLDALGEALFVAHMVQHLLLLLVAPPLLLAARPLGPVLLGLPGPFRRGAGVLLRAGLARAARALSRRAVVVLALHGLALWAWHAPRAYDAALASELVHALEHASFFAAGLLFWSVLHGAARKGGVGHGGAVLFVFGGAMQGGGLGALLTVATRPLYESHRQSAPAFGLSALEDQQLAGVVMWVPSGIVLAVVALAHASLLLELEGPAPTRGGGGS